MFLRRPSSSRSPAVPGLEPRDPECADGSMAVAVADRSPLLGGPPTLSWPAAPIHRYDEASIQHLGRGRGGCRPNAMLSFDAFGPSGTATGWQCLCTWHTTARGGEGAS